jgi:hypothetical protein
MSTRALRSPVFLLLGALACSTTGYIAGRHTHATSSFANTSASAASVSSALPLFRASAISENTATTLPASSTLAPSAWKTLLASPPSPATEQTLLASLRTLAATNPALALELAQTAPTPRQRDEFIRAALHGWGSANPQAAAQWTLAHVRLGERRLAFDALVAGAIANPEAAILATRSLCAADPLLQSDHGHTLVTALARAGRFDLATQFAATASSEFRAYWLSTAFSQWAHYQPSAALTAASELANASARTDALQGVITGWAASDPAALVAHVQKLPSSELRASALRDGLQQWVSLDPVAASAWMDRLDPSRDLDAGAAAVATTPVIVEKKPDVAASWAESIVDPELRADTLLDLIRLWAARDPAAARSYAANSPALRPETRAVALASFEHQTAP